MTYKELKENIAADYNRMLQIGGVFVEAAPQPFV